MAVHGLHNWTERLRAKNMPVLGDVIMELNKVTGKDDAVLNHVAEVILRDPNLTSHVLRVANSVQYNYSRAQISTVSRAIVHIGLKGMRAICISLMVIDALLKDRSKERLLQLAAQGFHAATQARNMAESIDPDSGEEAFIAGLLFNLGEMAFWASEKITENNRDLLSDNAQVRRAAMERVLGTSFKSITRELSKNWRLGETLEKALFPDKEPTPLVQAVITGERLSRAVLYGWESPQLRKVLQEVADYTGTTLDDALKKVKESGDQAAAVALDYGVSEACPLIPSSAREVIIKKADAKPKILKADVAVQLNILRDLASATHDGLEVNTIFQMVLEGMHRGIGLERVSIAFVKGRRLVAKYLLGEGADHWRSSFNFDVGPYSDSIFCHAIENGGSYWFDDDALEQKAHLFTDETTSVLGKLPCFVHALDVKGRRTAIFYADRYIYGGKLSEDKFESFKHFCNQAQISLDLLSSKSDDKDKNG